MKKTNRSKYTVIALLLTASLLFCGCGEDGTAAEISKEIGNAETEYINADDEKAGGDASAAQAAVIDADGAFANRDKDAEFDEETAVRIELSDSGILASSEKVTVEGGKITVTDEGEYVFSGSLTDGMIIVDAEKTDKLKLVFDGVKIHSATSAALYVKTADKVVVTLLSGSENELVTDGEYVPIDENTIDSTVFSKEDITFNGDGKLTVSSAFGHGIVSKDDVKFCGGSYEITSSGHGISGKDRVYVLDSDFIISSGKDSIHSENKDDEMLGEVLILGGDFTLESDGDGIDGGAIVQIDGGEFKIITGGGHKNAKAHAEDFGGGFGGFGGWGTFGENESESDEDDSVSVKGIKADGMIYINGGSLTLDTADDGIHAGGDVNVTDGTLNLTAGDDGIHSDANVTVSGGVTAICESYEGIEGVMITVIDGKIEIFASDDGLNAAGGSSQEGFGGGGFGGFGGFGGGMMDGSDEYGINISGGYLYVNADGDGLDSNGFLLVSGGETYVDGPTNSANGALDYGTSAKITGGTVVAVGAAGMAENFDSESTQGSILISVSGKGKISLSDTEGNVLAEHEPQKSYSSVLVSATGIGDSGDYLLTVGDTSTTITMQGYVYGAGMGGFGGGGFGGGGFGGPGEQPGGGKGPGGRGGR